MVSAGERLDGWKAIAGYFGRERTTVIRWARHRGMPVHALPGGKTRTVYALVSELEEWARSHEQADNLADADAAEAEDADARPAPPIPQSGHRPSRLRRLSYAGGAVAVLASVVTFGVLRPHPSPARASASAHQPLPGNPAAADLLLQARDDWAKRTAESLNRSVQEFQRVTVLEPTFAPGFADLADSYLLAGEAGSLAPSVVFDGAQHAADQALALDPTLASAHRAKGFIQYWWKHDPAGAGLEFREAIRLDPASSQTHFWFANVLADNGQDAPAQREFDRARLADPGSDQIGADYAWARWIAGHSAEAEASLRAIVAARPGNAEAQDCLAMIALSSGDYRTYLEALRTEARLREEPEFADDVRGLETAFRQGGGKAMLQKALAAKMDDQAQSPYPDHALAAYYASLAGDRATLLRILTLAGANRERWGSAGYLRRMRAQWQSDHAVPAALDHLAAAPINSFG